MLAPFVLAVQIAGARTIEFETTEVTSPDVALSPDGKQMVLTILGHLFRLPVQGGTAEQLTFGPYYDSDPAFSPDGARVAFVSDRDGSEGNVFLLDLATGRIRQLTRERWVARPNWTPDGHAVVYLSLLREVPGVVPNPRHSIPDTVPALVRRAPLSGGEAETLRAPAQLFRSVFHLPDGRLASVVVDLSIEARGGRVVATSRVEVLSPDGEVSILHTFPGYGDLAVPSPSGNGVFCRSFHPLLPWHTQGPEDFLFLPLPDGDARRLFALTPTRGWTPRFAVAPDSGSLYLGEAGRIWKVALPSRARSPVPFEARVSLEVRDPIPPGRLTRPQAGSSASPRAVLDPRLSPDGQILVFGAAGYIWQQPLRGGPAKRLFTGGAIERCPALSPDGKHLASVHSENGKNQIKVFNLEDGETRVLASGQNYWSLSWSPDGSRLLFVEWATPLNRLIALNPVDGSRETLADIAWWWGARPHLSADGKLLYYTGPPGAGQLYRMPLTEKTKPQAATQLRRQLTRALVSPDDQWLAFKRNTEIWMAPLGSDLIKEEHIRRLSAEGGDSFGFTSDGEALIYSAGNRVWRHPFDGGEREELPIRLELPRPTPPPLLIGRVRLLDFDAGGFGPETSVFIEQGRIAWIGSEPDREVPPKTAILDGGGQFGIPGLFDLHVHEQEANQQERFLAYAVTSVRDVSGWLNWLNALADRSDASSDAFPR